MDQLGRLALPACAAALLTVVFWSTISRVLREDRSRIGTLGALAIVLGAIVRWQALEHVATPRLLEICMAAQTVPRAAMIGLAWVSRPVGTGLGLALSSTLSTPAAVIALAQGVIAAMLCGVRPGFAILAGVYLIVRMARWYCYRRMGGVNGDSLGATQQLVEIFVLVLFSAMPSTAFPYGATH